MTFSISSLLITLFMSTLMISLYVILVTNNKVIYLMRYDFLLVLAFIIIIRLLFPFEWGFTITIPFSQLMNPLQSFFEFEIVDGIPVKYLLLFIWGISSFIQFWRFGRRLKKIDLIISMLDKIVTKRHVSDFLLGEQKYDYPVWISKDIPSPMILGFKKIILLPDLNLTDIEIKNILLHEIEHFKHHDNMIKLFMNLLSIVYWWFPPIYWLNSRIQLIMELRVDHCVTKRYSKKELLDYAETLVAIKRKVTKETRSSDILNLSSAFYINDGSDTLLYRINYLIKSDFKKKSNAILILLIILVPILSNSIVFEAYSEPSIDNYSSFSADNLEKGFILQHDDGTYSLYIKGNIKPISEPDEELLSKYPVIHE